MKPNLSMLCALFFHCLTGSLGAFGQTESLTTGFGTPPSHLYMPSQYKAHSQNFVFTQDHRGVLYVGNFAGVLEYDGLNWRTIPTRNITKVSALLTATDGTIYVGGNGEFGYLAPDSTGLLAFVSLTRQLPPALANSAFLNGFGQILTIMERNDGLYFIAPKHIIRLSGKKLALWRSRQEILSAFRVDQQLYMVTEQGGVRQFQHNQLVPVAARVRIQKVVAALPGVGGKTLLITGKQGLFQLSDQTISPINGLASTYLTTNQATSATVLRDGSIAVGTGKGQVMTLTPNGQLRQVVQSIGDLHDPLINSLFTDREGTLWLALNNGLAQVDIPSPLTLFSESARFTGEVMDIRQVEGVIYLATINGLFRINNNAIQAIDGLKTGCFALASQGGSLYVATSQGVNEVTNGAIRPLTNHYSLCLTVSSAHPGVLYAGTETGLDILTVVPGKAPEYRTVPSLNVRVSGLLEDKAGNLWIETLKSGLYKLNPSTSQLTRYDTRQGLKTMFYNQIAQTAEGLLVFNEKGLFRFDAPRDRFVPYNPFGRQALATMYWKNSLITDKNGDMWTVEGDKNQVTWYQKQRHMYRAIQTPFFPISTSPINVIYPDPTGIVWFGGRDGVVRYDARVSKKYDQPYQALIRQIQTTGDKKLFNGYQLQTNPAVNQLSLPYTSNDISFEFSAPSFPVNNVLTFSYKLENYDKNWSDSTSTKDKKEYTNLPAGQYQFRVKARNLYGNISREAIYTFRVSPPWYGRWWVIVLFVLAASLLIYWVVRWRLGLLVREKQELETVIRERTEEVVFQAGELEKQSEELAITNNQLEKIDVIVQSINTEIDSTSLFQTILDKFSVLPNVDNVSAIAYDQSTQSFRVRALRSNHNLDYVASVQLSQEQLEKRFLTQSVEVYEDIYCKDVLQYEPLGNALDDLTVPRSLITIVLKNEDRVEGFITLENSARPQAFSPRDMIMVRSLKEHLIAAFIKIRLLENLANTLSDLKNTQDELIRQEKLASVGQLTKGIVDRILNPLNYVSNFSQSSEAIIDDLLDMIHEQQNATQTDTLDSMAEDMTMLKNNHLKIQEHSNSTTRILKDMQKLLREKSRDFLETDLNSFIDSKARTIAQEIRASYKDFAVNLVMDLPSYPIRTQLLPYEFGQVVYSLLSNAYYTLYEKSKTVPGFAAEIQIETRLVREHVVIKFRDNGKGIPQREREKIFSPFFTTKPTSKGTGLGLFMVKDIIETHKGKVDIRSEEGNFTEVIIMLPALLT